MLLPTWRPPRDSGALEAGAREAGAREAAMGPESQVLLFLVSDAFVTTRQHLLPEGDPVFVTVEVIGEW